VPPLGGRGADADDVRQEVFQAAAQSIANFRRDREGDPYLRLPGGQLRPGQSVMLDLLFSNPGS
jgi:Sigma-70 region 2